ncbi:MAG: hypothetical protein ABR587_05440 [Candidatus Binatia bacterium]
MRFPSATSLLNCDVKIKAKFWCIDTARDGSDDLRGGQLGLTVCYKAKCEGPVGSPFSFDLDTAFGNHRVEDFSYEKAALICMPVGNEFD